MRAIILAAGEGTRLRPLTLTTPKSLVKVNGQPMLERQIQWLRLKGIDEIIVLTGYMHEKFDYLADKYNVKLIHNDKYHIYNNIYTMYLVRHYLADAYVLEADVYLNHDISLKNPTSSLYFSAIKRNFKNEWVLEFDGERRLKKIEVRDGDNEYIQCGISYWTKQDAAFIAKKLEQAINLGNFKDLYWDNIVKDNISSLNIKLQPIHSDDTFEIDNMNELIQVEYEVTKPSVADLMAEYSLFKRVEAIEKNRILEHQDRQRQHEHDMRYGLVPVNR